MSNLQVLARRCPIMGKAMAVQGAKSGIASLGGVFGGARAYGGKAKMHTTRAQKATVDTGLLGHRDYGLSALIQFVLQFTNLRLQHHHHQG